MAKVEPNLLFSTNTELAYRIASRYYDDLHYVWCSTAFGSPRVGDPLTRNPRSSLPYERYRELLKDSGRSPDHHSALVEDQRTGIKYGAQQKFKAREITRGDRDDIIACVDGAETQDFAPLIYVMPFAKVKRLAKRVPVAKRAHPLSDEWLIEKLPRSMFEVINFE